MLNVRLLDYMGTFLLDFHFMATTKISSLKDTSTKIFITSLIYTQFSTHKDQWMVEKLIHLMYMGCNKNNKMSVFGFIENKK